MRIALQRPQVHLQCDTNHFFASTGCLMFAIEVLILRVGMVIDGRLVNFVAIVTLSDVILFGACFFKEAL